MDTVEEYKAKLNVYIKKIFENALDKNSTCQNFQQVRKEGNRTVNRKIPYYNLYMIIT